ncbi:MAG: acyl-CoA dehydrogenase family protein [Candidatus Eiseniibacteriota bacterium]
MTAQTVKSRPSSTSGRDPSADDILAGVRELVPLAKKRARQTEDARMVSPEIIEALRATGLFRLLQPKRFGGLEHSFTDFVRLSIELGQGCGSTAWCAGIAIIHNWVAGLWPLEAQQEVWDDPQALVCGSYVPKSKCEPVSGGYKVTGRWDFMSNCDHSAWFIVGMVIPPAAEGKPPMPAWALIPRADARIDDTWYAMGMCGTGSKTVAIDEPTFVPAHRVLPVPVINSGDAPGAKINTNPIYKLTFTGAAPYTLCSVPVGVAAGALKDFVEGARTKMATQPGGPPRPMAELAHVQVAIADASAAIDAATTLLLRDTAAMEAKLKQGVLPSVDERITYRRNQAYAAAQSAHAVGALFEAQGASAGDLSSPIQRAWRDTNFVARHMSLGWQATGTMYGQHQLGLQPRGTF